MSNLPPMPPHPYRRDSLSNFLRYNQTIKTKKELKTFLLNSNKKRSLTDEDKEIIQIIYHNRNKLALTLPQIVAYNSIVINNNQDQYFIPLDQ